MCHQRLSWWLSVHGEGYSMAYSTVHPKDQQYCTAKETTLSLWPYSMNTIFLVVGDKAEKEEWKFWGYDDGGGRFESSSWRRCLDEPVDVNRKCSTTTCSRWDFWHVGCWLEKTWSDNQSTKDSSRRYWDISGWMKVVERPVCQAWLKISSKIRKKKKKKSSLPLNSSNERKKNIKKIGCGAVWMPVAWRQPQQQRWDTSLTGVNDRRPMKRSQHRSHQIFVSKSGRWMMNSHLRGRKKWIKTRMATQ